MLTAGSGPACGYGFKPGERYLVYANRKGTELVTGICSRTRPLADATEDLEFFQSFQRPANEPVSMEPSPTGSVTCRLSSHETMVLCRAFA